MDDSESVQEQNDGQSSSSSVIEPSTDVCSASTSVPNLCGSGDKTFDDDCWLSVHKKSFVCSDTPTIKRKKQSMGDLKVRITILLT